MTDTIAQPVDLAAVLRAFADDERLVHCDGFHMDFQDLVTPAEVDGKAVPALGYRLTVDLEDPAKSYCGPSIFGLDGWEEFGDGVAEWGTEPVLLAFQALHALQTALTTTIPGAQFRLHL